MMKFEEEEGVVVIISDSTAGLLVLTRES